MIRRTAGCRPCCRIHAYDAVMLRYLARRLGASQVMIGAGYPFGFRNYSPVAHVVAVP
jgi:hypothetical protein